MEQLIIGDIPSTAIQNLDRVVYKAIEDKIIPGIEILFFKQKQKLLHKVYGHSRIYPHEEILEPNSIFDIASISKIISTTTLTMLLLEKGLLTLNSKVSHYFDEYKASPKDKITLFHLLTHTSGLPAWDNLYENMESQSKSISKLLNLPLEYNTGEKMIYSCMGFITLKLILEKICSDTLDNLSQELIFKPLNMKNTFFNPPNSLLNQIVPTGYCNWRKKIIHGKVHDENCYQFNGIGGNAGVFSTVHDLFNYGLMILQKGWFDNNKFLSKATINLMISNQLPPQLSPRGIGFQLNDEEHRPSGELYTKDSAGHLGFTGTSIWVDPNYELGIILLSNRVHLSYRDNIEGIKPLRMKAQNILISSVI